MQQPWLTKQHVICALELSYFKAVSFDLILLESNELFSENNTTVQKALLWEKLVCYRERSDAVLFSSFAPFLF